MAELISVKLSKEDQKKISGVMVDEASREEFPWGLRLTFNPEISDRFPVLANLAAEEEVAIVAEGKVMEIRVADVPGNSSRTVEIQITRMQLISKESYDAAFDDATK